MISWNYYIIKELKVSGKTLLLPGQMKKLRNPFHFRTVTQVSYSLLKKNPLRAIGYSKVPPLPWHQNFHFKSRRTQGCLPPLVLNFKKDFSVLSVSDNTIRAFGISENLCGTRISLKVAEMPFRWNQPKYFLKYRKRKHPRPKYLGRKLPTQMFYTVKYLDSPLFYK